MAEWDVEVDGTIYRIEGGDTPPTEQEARDAVRYYSGESSDESSNYNLNGQSVPLSDVTFIGRQGEPGLDATPLDIAADVSNTQWQGILDRVPGYRPVMTHSMYVGRYLTDPEYRKIPYSEAIKHAESQYLDYLGAERNPAAYTSGMLAGIPATATFIPGGAAKAGAGTVAQSYLKGLGKSTLGGSVYGAALSLSDALARGELPSLQDFAGSTVFGGLAGGAGYSAVRGGLAGAEWLANKLAPAAGIVSTRLGDYLREFHPSIYNKLYKGATTYKNVSGVGKKALLSSVSDDAVRYGTVDDPLFVTPNSFNEDAITEIAMKDVGSARNIGVKIKPYQQRVASEINNNINSYGKNIGTPADLQARELILSGKYAGLENKLRNEVISYDDLVKAFSEGRGTSDAETIAQTIIDGIRGQASVGTLAEMGVATGTKIPSNIVSKFDDLVSEYSKGRSILEATRMAEKSLRDSKLLDYSQVKVPASALHSYVKTLAKKAVTNASKEDAIVMDGLLNAISKKVPMVRSYKQDYNTYYKIAEGAAEGRSLYNNSSITQPEAIRGAIYKPVTRYDSKIGMSIDDKPLTDVVINARKTGFVSKIAEDMNKVDSFIEMPNKAQQSFFATEASASGGKSLTDLVEHYNYLKRISDITDAASGKIKEPAVDALNAAAASLYSNKLAAIANAPVTRRALSKMGVATGTKRLNEFMQLPVREVDKFMYPGTDILVPYSRAVGGRIGVVRRDEKRKSED